MQDFQELADEAFADLLHKQGGVLMSRSGLMSTMAPTAFWRSARQDPSVEKKDQPAPSYDQQRRFDRFNDAVALKVTFDRPDDAQDDDEDPPVPSHQVEQPKLWVHLRARERAPPERSSQAYRERQKRRPRARGA
jgi:hypothetical protein